MAPCPLHPAPTRPHARLSIPSDAGSQTCRIGWLPVAPCGCRALHQLGWRRRPPALQRSSLRMGDGGGRRVARRGLGFQLETGPHKSGEEIARDLIVAAASVLVFQAVLKGKVAQALLKVLRALPHCGPEDLLQYYGSFYQELTASGFSSWQDLLLDEVWRRRPGSMCPCVDPAHYYNCAPH